MTDRAKGQSTWPPPASEEAYGRAFSHLRAARMLEDRAFGRIGGTREVRDVFGGGTLGLAADRWSELTAYLERRLSASAGISPAAPAQGGDAAANARPADCLGEIVRLAEAKFETNVSGGMLQDFRDAMRELISAEQLATFVDEFADPDPDACGEIRRELDQAIACVRRPWAAAPATSPAVSLAADRGALQTGPDDEAGYEVRLLHGLRTLIEAQRAVITESRRSLAAILTAARDALVDLHEADPHEADLHEADSGSTHEVVLAVTGTATRTTNQRTHGGDRADSAARSDGADEPFRVEIGGDSVYAIWKSMDDALLRLEADALAECVEVNEALGQLLPGRGDARREPIRTSELAG